MGIASDDSLAAEEAECLTTTDAHHLVATFGFADGHSAFWT